jgi:hypothetical protein
MACGSPYLIRTSPVELDGKLIPLHPLVLLTLHQRQALSSIARPP